ncbi:hypothetical protein [Alloyangia pacifica]|uniref:Uncharacterized protein n=1 Tax=Alloyangia pacifica TaxID=311180 RepID=A0A1I6PP21_9RHOB|nr:hypothetical protein [Alloyangia pacifica]SDG32522.1 hypothetical protein SAMN04488245_102374 [Alloyangia pacifica]SFS41973.1 hypothetical protein SAMN04488050_101675 [Alloyangia pacifica]
MSHYKDILMREITALSVADIWEEAKREWRLLYIIREENGTCLCTYHPITDQCVIENRLNGRMTVVGNVCVNEFLGIDTSTLLAGYKRIEFDSTSAPNEALIHYAFRHGWIGTRERDFLLDTCRKRKLSGKQMDWRIALNDRIVRNTRNII